MSIRPKGVLLLEILFFEACEQGVLSAHSRMIWPAFTRHHVHPLTLSLASWSKPGISAPGPPTNLDYGTKTNRSNMRHRFPNTDPHRPHCPEERRNRHKVERRKSFCALCYSRELLRLPSYSTTPFRLHTNYPCSYSRSTGSVAGKPKV